MQGTMNLLLIYNLLFPFLSNSYKSWILEWRLNYLWVTYPWISGIPIYLEICEVSCHLSVVSTLVVRIMCKFLFTCTVRFHDILSIVLILVVTVMFWLLFTCALRFNRHVIILVVRAMCGLLCTFAVKYPVTSL